VTFKITQGIGNGATYDFVLLFHCSCVCMYLAR